VCSIVASIILSPADIIRNSPNIQVFYQKMLHPSIHSQDKIPSAYF
jgi:hypothetical protein